MIEGRCLCGAVTLRVADHRPEIGACHCSMCRRWTGTVFAAFDAPAAAVSVTGPVAVYRSSPFAERAFCRTCGSHLWLRDDGKDYELLPGLFDAAADFPLVSEIYVDCRIAALRLEGSHPRGTRAEYEARNPFVEGEV